MLTQKMINDVSDALDLFRMTLDELQAAIAEPAATHTTLLLLRQLRFTPDELGTICAASPNVRCQSSHLFTAPAFVSDDELGRRLDLNIAQDYDGVIWIDLEHDDTRPLIAAGAAKIRAERPLATIGLYAPLNITPSGAIKTQYWTAEQVHEAGIDVIGASVYDHYDDTLAANPSVWLESYRRFAGASIAQHAEQYGLPVYAFISPYRRGHDADILLTEWLADLDAVMETRPAGIVPFGTRASIAARSGAGDGWPMMMDYMVACARRCGG